MTVMLTSSPTSRRNVLAVSKPAKLPPKMSTRCICLPLAVVGPSVDLSALSILFDAAKGTMRRSGSTFYGLRRSKHDGAMAVPFQRMYLRNGRGGHNAQNRRDAQNGRDGQTRRPTPGGSRRWPMMGLVGLALVALGGRLMKPMVRRWLHDAARNFGDRLLSDVYKENLWESSVLRPVTGPQRSWRRALRAEQGTRH